MACERCIGSVFDGQGAAEPVLAGEQPFSVSRATFSSDGHDRRLPGVEPRHGARPLGRSGLTARERPNRFCKRRSMKASPRCRPTDAGWRIASNETGQSEVTVQPCTRSGAQIASVNRRRHAADLVARRAGVFYRNDGDDDGRQDSGIRVITLAGPGATPVSKERGTLVTCRRTGGLLMIEGLPALAARPITVVLNWSREKR